MLYSCYDYTGSFVPVYRKGVKRLSGLSGTDDVKVIVAGPKFDMSLDESGLARIEKFSYESYNETGLCRGRSSAIALVPVTTRNGSWSTRSIG